MTPSYRPMPTAAPLRPSAPRSPAKIELNMCAIRCPWTSGASPLSLTTRSARCRGPGSRRRCTAAAGRSLTMPPTSWSPGTSRVSTSGTATTTAAACPDGRCWSRGVFCCLPFLFRAVLCFGNERYGWETKMAERSVVLPPVEMFWAQNGMRQTTFRDNPWKRRLLLPTESLQYPRVCVVF